MKNLIKGLGVAALLAAGSFSYAQADAKMMMEGAAFLQHSYSQCLMSSDMKMLPRRRKAWTRSR
ncbi:MAG: hypothetical protein R3D29_11585 [Nitratireductor sp.]